MGVLIALAGAGSAVACSCVNTTPAEGLQRADAAIVGRLVEVVPRTEYKSEFRFEVRRLYKGERVLAPGKVVSVLSASSGSACGLPTELGRHYGLFLARRGGRWHGSSCATIGLRKLHAAARDVRRWDSDASAPPGCDS
jgi:hypothetical protein